MRAASLAAAILTWAAMIAPACGGSDDERSASVGPSTTPQEHPGNAQPPEEVSTPKPDPGGAAGEASPEASAQGPETGELSGSDEEAVTRAVSAYVDAVNRHDAAGVCSTLALGALRASELRSRRGGCVDSVGASLGSRPPGGGPAWRRTRIIELSAVSVEGGGARVTATVIHRFRDRKEPSVEEDVIYLERVDGRWLIAKPSTTFYRAIGYADPPLSALAPP